MRVFYTRNKPAAMNYELTVSRSAGLPLAGEGAHLGVEFTFRFGAALSWCLHELAVSGQGTVGGTSENQTGTRYTSVITVQMRRYHWPLNPP